MGWNKEMRNEHVIEDRIIYLELKKMQINQAIKELKQELKVMRGESSWMDLFLSIFKK
jgi:hypothetical protein